MNDQPTSTKQAAFDRTGFLRALQTLPSDMIVEMARDGVICEMEIARIFDRMRIPPEQIRSLQPHLNAIARLVLDYGQKEMGLKIDMQLCRLSCAESIAIMEGLLKRGLIQRYFEMVNASGQPLPPAVGLAQVQGKDGLAPRPLV
jgi:hypothetical protein